MKNRIRGIKTKAGRDAKKARASKSGILAIFGIKPKAKAKAKAKTVAGKPGRKVSKPVDTKSKAGKNVSGGKRAGNKSGKAFSIPRGTGRVTATNRKKKSN